MSSRMAAMDGESIQVTRTVAIPVSEIELRFSRSPTIQTDWDIGLEVPISSPKLVDQVASGSGGLQNARSSSPDSTRA